MSTQRNPRRRWPSRHGLIGAAVVGALVAVAVLTLGAAAGRQVAQHGSGDRSAVHSAMSSTHSLSRAQGHASLVSRASGHAAHLSHSSSGSSLFNASLFPDLARNRLLATTSTGCGVNGTIADASGFEDADGNLAGNDTTDGCTDWRSSRPVAWPG